MPLSHTMKVVYHVKKRCSGMNGNNVSTNIRCDSYIWYFKIMVINHAAQENSSEAVRKQRQKFKNGNSRNCNWCQFCTVSSRHVSPAQGGLYKLCRGTAFLYSKVNILWSSGDKMLLYFSIPAHYTTYDIAYKVRQHKNFR